MKNYPHQLPLAQGERPTRGHAPMQQHRASSPFPRGSQRGFNHKSKIINQKSNSFSQPGVNRIGRDFPVGGHGQAVDVDVLRLDEGRDGDGGYATIASVA